MAHFSWLSSRLRRRQPGPYADLPEKSNPTSERSSADTHGPGALASSWKPGVDVKRATRARRNALIFAAVCFALSVIFMILVEIGNTYVRPVLNDIYFLKLDVSNIIPQSVPDATLINSIARTLGLHDFYTVGLWNYCEGYNTNGVTQCSSPRPLYWFNPVSILLGELLSGATSTLSLIISHQTIPLTFQLTVSLPSEILDILKIVEKASHWMFACLLTGVCLDVIAIPLMILPLFTRWNSLPVTIFAFLAALFTTVGTILGTVIFVVFRDTVTNNGVGINLEASIGGRMFAFMWIASGFAILGWLLNLGMCCCGASRRDVKTGRRKGNKHAYPNSSSPSALEKNERRRRSP
ncbi:MAG: hypothetical protein M4579_004583 [Chaenotheca gracillima]|nr:MAG: hypothetical protein M4579_004583 [Chaenotheca gracillima]